MKNAETFNNSLTMEGSIGAASISDMGTLVIVSMAWPTATFLSITPSLTDVRMASSSRTTEAISNFCSADGVVSASAVAVASLPSINVLLSVSPTTIVDAVVPAARVQYLRHKRRNMFLQPLL